MLLSLDVLSVCSLSCQQCQIAEVFWEECSTSEEMLMQMLYAPQDRLDFGMTRVDEADDLRPERDGL